MKANPKFLSLTLAAFLMVTSAGLGQEEKPKTKIVDAEEPFPATPPRKEKPKETPPKETPMILYVDEHGYGIPEGDFNPRLETDPKKFREQYKIDYPEGLQPKGVNPDWRPQTEADIHYDQAGKEGLRRSYSQNQSAYIPIIAHRKVLDQSKNQEYADLALQFAEVTGKQAAEAARTGKPFDHVKSREEFMKTAAWEFVKNSGGDIPIPVLSTIIRGGLEAADANLKYQTQDKTPANYGTMAAILAGDSETLKRGAEKAAEALENGQVGNLFGASVLTDEQLDENNRAIGTAGQIAVNAYLRRQPFFQFSGALTPENIKALNPDYANSQRLKNVEGVVNWLKSSQQRMEGSLEEIGTRTFATEFRVAALGVVLQKMNESNEKAFDDLRKADEALQQQIALMGGEVTATKNTVNAIADYLKKKEDKERAQAEYEQMLGLYDSAASLIPQFAGLTKDKRLIKAADKVSKVVKIAKKVHQLATVAKGISKMSGIAKAAFTMDIASVGLSIVGLFSNQKDMDTQILEAVEKLTKEMHERFDHIETMLQEIDKKLDLHFDHIEEALAMLRVDVREANERLLIVQSDLDKFMENFAASMDELRKLANDPEELKYLNLVQRTITLRKLHPQQPVKTRAFLEAVADFSHWAQNAPLKSPFLMPVVMYQDRASTIEESVKPFRQYNLNQSFATDKVHFKIEAPRIGEVPDITSWRRAAEGLVEYILLHPEHFSQDVSAELQNASEVGLKIREAIKVARTPERVTKVLATELELTKKLLETVRDLHLALRTRNLVPPGVSVHKWLASRPTVTINGRKMTYPYDPSLFRERPEVSYQGHSTVMGPSAGVVMHPALRLISHIRAANRLPPIQFSAWAEVLWRDDKNPKATEVQRFTHYYPRSYLVLSHPEAEGTVKSSVVNNRSVFYTSQAGYIDAENPNEFPSPTRRRVGYFVENKVTSGMLSEFFAKNLTPFFAEEHVAEWVPSEKEPLQDTAVAWLEHELQLHQDNLWKELQSALTPNPQLSREAGVGYFHHLGQSKAVKLTDSLLEISRVAQWKVHNLNLIAPELLEAFVRKYEKNWHLSHFVAEALENKTDPDTILQKVEAHVEEMNQWLVSELARTEESEDRYGVVDDVLSKLDAIYLIKDRERERNRIVDEVIRSLK